MKPTTLSEKEHRRRRFLLVLPVIVLPLMTLLFWVLGGGRAGSLYAKQTPAGGFNTKLPDAKLSDDSALNKMSYYDRAAADSAKLRQLTQADPYYRAPVNRDTAAQVSLPDDSRERQPFSAEQTAAVPGQRSGAVESTLRRKLVRLQAAIDQPPAASITEKAPYAASAPAAVPAAVSAPVAEDPELRQMNGILERILDIQHPERVVNRSDSGAVSAANVRFLAIPAVIDGKQNITEGSVVRLKLLDTVTISGQLIPRGQLIYGTGRLYNQRLAMVIKLIRMGHLIIPADLTVFDMTDGLEGISVPEAVTGDAVRSGAVNGVQSMELMSLDPSLSAQLTGAGITAAKGLFSKKVKRIKATLKDGHQLLLRDNQKLKSSRN